MANPFITSSMVWDGDINPEGLAEQFKHTFNFNVGGGSSGAAVESYSKDGKTVSAAATTAEPGQKISLDLYANFGQFVYDDTNPENPIGANPQGLPKNDSYLLGWQVGAKVNLPHNLYVQLSPTLYNYTGVGDSFAAPSSAIPRFA